MKKYKLVTEEQYQRDSWALRDEGATSESRLFVIPDYVLMALEKSPEELKRLLRPMLEEIKEEELCSLKDALNEVDPLFTDINKHWQEEGEKAKGSEFGHIHLPGVYCQACNKPTEKEECKHEMTDSLGLPCEVCTCKCRECYQDQNFHCHGTASGKCPNYQAVTLRPSEIIKSRLPRHTVKIYAKDYELAPTESDFIAGILTFLDEHFKY